MSINVKIKWSGKCFDYELPQDAKIKELKQKIEAETNVLADRQKLGLRNKKVYTLEKQLPRPIESSSV
jgi:ubiquitin-like domain-containing CTD phosphatase 1